MEFNINTIAALLALFVAAITVLVRLMEKNLSLREHEEFKTALRSQLEKFATGQEARLVIREFHDWRVQIARDFDRIEADIRLIDATKPSAGELQEAMKAVNARVAHLELITSNLGKQH